MLAVATRVELDALRSTNAAPASQRVFLVLCAVIFIASTATTILWCASMSSMGSMPTTGGGSVSMAWMPMCGQSWLGTAASFLGMWVVMMIAMMLPSLVPALSRYRRAIVVSGAAPLGRSTLQVGTGYFLIWTLFGVAVFPLGAAFAMARLQWPALSLLVPWIAGTTILGAGVLQFSRWKTHHLACCRAHAVCASPSPTAAWRHGLRMGVHCLHCCAGPTAVLLVVGVMDLWAMAAASIAITLERLLPDAERAAHGIGFAAVAAGSFLVARATGF